VLKGVVGKEWGGWLCLSKEKVNYRFLSFIVPVPISFRRVALRGYNNELKIVGEGEVWKIEK
jgi:predicted amidophosphoribosyltransferase